MMELLYPEPPPGPCICVMYRSGNVAHTAQDCPRHGWENDPTTHIIDHRGDPVLDLSAKDADPVGDVKRFVDLVHKGY